MSSLSLFWLVRYRRFHCVDVKWCVTLCPGVKLCAALCLGVNGVWHYRCWYQGVSVTVFGAKWCVALCAGVKLQLCLPLCSGPNGVWHYRCWYQGVSVTVFGAKWCVTLQVLVSRGVCHCVLCCTVFGGGAKWCVALCAGVKLQLCLPLCSGPNGVWHYRCWYQGVSGTVFGAKLFAALCVSVKYWHVVPLWFYYILKQ
jgi:hypothetical protein